MMIHVTSPEAPEFNPIVEIRGTPAEVKKLANALLEIVRKDTDGKGVYIKHAVDGRGFHNGTIIVNTTGTVPGTDIQYTWK